VRVPQKELPVNRTVLVTGGAGFIGSHLVRALLEAGDRVRVLDNYATGSAANLAPVLADIEMTEGDLRDAAAVREAVDGADIVFHQAALPSVPRSIAEPQMTSQVNIEGTLNVLVAAKEEGVRRVVYASSSSIYGHGVELPKRESMTPCPRSPYALTKFAAEYYCQLFYNIYGLETVSLRYFNVFGPRQDPNSQYSAVIPRFISHLLAGERPVIYGTGGQSRDFTYVGNVVRANLLAAETPDAAGAVLNVACGKQTSLLELATTISRLLGEAHTLPPIHEPERPGDVRHSFADISRAEQVLGYSPQVDLEDGLRLTIDWFRETHPSERC
jgi:UDP-glucose 4-epimerase